MENRYFDFLCAIVGRSQEYGVLLEELHKIEFYSLIPNDDNRGSDGIHLRDIFLDEGGLQRSSFIPPGGCTVLEMLIGLSYRLEFETIQSKWEKAPHEWFWILIDNLRLTWCDADAVFVDPDVRLIIERNITTMLSRNYLENGDGGLFPLKKPKRDQRKVEIWYQMTDYMYENYPIYF